MKINESLFRAILSGESTQKNQAAGDFAEALKAAVNQTSSSSVPTSVSASSELLSVSPTASLMAVREASPEAQVQRLLSALDEYSQGLADPQKSLKDLEPLVADLEKGAADLSELNQTLPEGSELKDLCGQASILATVEAAKFRRGDFV